MDRNSNVTTPVHRKKKSLRKKTPEEAFTFYNDSIEAIKKFDSAENLVKTPAGHESIFYIKSILSLNNDVLEKTGKPREEIISLLQDEDLIKRFVEILIYLADNRDKLDFTDAAKVPNNFDTYREVNENELSLFIFYHLNHIFNMMLPVSSKYSSIMSNKECLKAFQLLLSDDDFIDNIIAYKREAIQILVFNLNLLSKIADDYKSSWVELNIADTILNFSKKYKSYYMYIYMTLANILSEVQVKGDKKSIYDIIEQIINLTLNCIVKSSLNDVSIQEEFDDIDKENKIFNVRFINDSKTHTKIPITELLMSLYRFSIFDDLKFTIYENSKIKEVIKSLIFDGNEVEQQVSVLLLASLCLEPSICKMIQKNHEDIIRKCEELENNNSLIYKRLQNTAKDFMFWIRKELEDHQKPNEEKNRLRVKCEFDLMFTYNWANMDQVDRIKIELEKLGYKIWLDRDQMIGSSFEKTAEGINKSELILMCVSERYKSNYNCSCEARYAIQQQKKIVPIIMQKGFEKLSDLYGTVNSAVVNFSKEEASFKEKMSELKLIIKRLLHRRTAFKPIPPIESSLSFEDVSRIKSGRSRNFLNKEMKTWTEKEVEEWFKDNEMGALYEELKPMNGCDLEQLHEIQENDKEFFYQIILTNSIKELRNIVKLKSSFKKHFAKK